MRYNAVMATPLLEAAPKFCTALMICLLLGALSGLWLMMQPLEGDRPPLANAVKHAAALKSLPAAELIPRLHHRDQPVRRAARQILMLRTTESIPLLVAALEQEELHFAKLFDPSSAPSMILGELGTAATPALIDALSHRSERIRLGAAKALSVRPETRSSSQDALTLRLQDSSAEVRMWSAFALGVQGAAARTKLPDLLHCLSDGDPRVRRTVLKALCKVDINHEAVVNALYTTAQKDGSLKVRREAAVLLGRSAAPQALSRLELLYGSKSELIRKAVLQSLAAKGPAGKAGLERLLDKADAPALQAIREALNSTAEETQ